MCPSDKNNNISPNGQASASVGSGDFFSRYPLKTFREGEIILIKDEVPTDVYVIEQGITRSYSIDPEGCMRIIAYNQKGEILPAGLAFRLIKKSDFFYEACNKCSVRMIPLDDFIDFLDKNNAYLQTLHTKTVKHLISLMHRVDALIQPSSLRKVALSLLYMPDQLGVNKRPHKPKLNISVTQQEIARLLGLTRETVGAELKKLNKMELIDCSRNSYIIHMNKLRKYLNTSSPKKD